MTWQGFLVLALLSALGVGILYAVAGSRVPVHWWGWIVKAFLSAGAAFVVGMALLGLPGAVFLEAIYGPQPNLPPDAAWPLAIFITQAWALMIAPASLVLRFATPTVVGWGHVGATALLTIAATFFFTLYLAGQYASP